MNRPAACAPDRARNVVLSLGSAMVDTVCHVDRLPRSGEGVVTTSHAQSAGGCAFNSARIIGQLGAPCSLLAPIGTGPCADFLACEIERCGLAPFHVDEPRDCGSCLCLIEPDGERTMITTPGIEREFRAAWFEHVDTAAFAFGIANGFEIEGSGGNAIISFFEEHPRMQFVYAPGPRICHVGKEKTARINALRPLWHLNDQEALAFTGASSVEAAGQALVEACNNTVVVTAGANGAHAFSEKGHVIVPIERVEPVDTIGAGDAHVGAFTAALAQGLSCEEALALANKAARAVCLVEGATLSDEDFARTGIGRVLAR